MTEASTALTVVRASEQIQLLELPGFALEPYVKMIRLIDECCEVDFVKAIRDKVEALRFYQHQANNHEAELKLGVIRLRAEHRAGELLREMLKTGERDAGKGGDRKSRNRDGTVNTKKLADLSITKKQSFLWQHFSLIPWDAIEWRLSNEEKPMTVSELLSERDPAKGISRENRAYAWIRHSKVDPRSERARMIREFPPEEMPPVDKYNYIVAERIDHDNSRNHKCPHCGCEWRYFKSICPRCGKVLLATAVTAICDYLYTAASLIVQRPTATVVAAMDPVQLEGVQVHILREFCDHVEQEIKLRGQGSKDSQGEVGKVKTISE